MYNKSLTLNKTYFIKYLTSMFCRQINVNLLAAVNVTQCVVKGMIERGVGGSILNISSSVTIGTYSSILDITFEYLKMFRLPKG